MENRRIKLYARNNGNVALQTIPGHFVTSHSHINYYIDLTSLKTHVNEAQDVARILAADYSKNTSEIDTIVCMDGTEVIGAFMAKELMDRSGYGKEQKIVSVVTPEYNSNNQMIFRDNTAPMISGRNIILLVATTTTGLTIGRSLECIRYYGGNPVGISSIFSTVKKISGMVVNSIFSEKDVSDYTAYPAEKCPFCKKGIRIDALVNGHGYSKMAF